MARQIMSINNKYLSDYDARLLSYSVGGSTIENDYTQGIGRTTLNFLNRSTGTRPVNFSVTIDGESRQDVSRKLSLLDFALSGQCELFLPDEFYYSCIFQSADEPIWQLPTRCEVGYQLIGTKHGKPMRTKLVNGFLHCEGTIKTDCCIEIVTETAAKSLQVSVQNERSSYMINVKNVRANEVLAINGMSCEVLMGSAHIFDDTDIIEFPYLMPGNNMIKTSQPATVTVTYNPTYL